MRASGFDDELEQGFARHLHFRAEGEAAVAIVAYDAPEIEGFAIADGFGIAASSAQARTSRELIEPAANAP